MALDILCAAVTKVNVYDETTKHEIIKLQSGSGYGTSSAPGHSNRVFALKFHPEDPEVSGWINYMTHSCTEKLPLITRPL